MKIIKRDGRAVDYDPSKIVNAIGKANQEVNADQRASESDVNAIVLHIESLNKKRMLVEDIQDIVEEKLMEQGHYELAKKYIIYRYTRALVRKQNTTDESILGLIKHSNKDVMEENSNKNAVIASTQRDLIAGEVSKDLTRRLLLPEKISKAHDEGIIMYPSHLTTSLSEGNVHARRLSSFTFVEKGELIAFTWRGAAPIPDGVTVIKRVAGVPGERVHVENRFVFIEQQPIGIAKTLSRTGEPLTHISDGVIPRLHFFAAGDHTDSFDSRYEKPGLIPFSSVRGRAYSLW